MSVWRGESEDVRKRGLEGRMVMEVEVDSLRGQVNTLQKVSLLCLLYGSS